MNHCKQIEFASLYYDDGLEVGERTQFEEHLTACIECQVALAEFRMISESLKEDAQPLFASKVEKRIFARRMQAAVSGFNDRSRERFTYPLLAAAAVLLMMSLSTSSYFLRDTGNLGSLAKHWVEYMVDDPISSNSDIDGLVDAEANFSDWMNYALAEDFDNE